jgi:hypothetical protein
MTEPDRAPSISTEDLRRLGLGDWLIEAEVELHDPRPRDRGLGRASMDYRALLAEPDFDRLESELGVDAAARLDELGFAVLRHRSNPALHAVSTPGLPRALTAEAQGVQSRAKELLVDVWALNGHVAMEAGANRVVLAGAGNGCVRVAVLCPRLVLDTPPSVRSDVRSWVDPADVWLQQTIDERLAVDPDPFDQATAVGLLLRLRPLELDQLGSFLRGERGPLADRERSWARGLRADQLDGIEDLARGEATVVEEELRELFESDAAMEGSAREQLLGLLRRRDVLEGVATLLDAAGTGRRLAVTLDRLDAWAAPAMAALPRLPGVDDEHLRRASRIEPEAWWVLPTLDAAAR